MYGVVELTIFLGILIILGGVIYLAREKQKKNEIKQKFKKFSKDHRLPKKEMRAVPRITIPDAMEVILTLTDDAFFGFKSRAVDMSLSGFAVIPDFPARKLSVNTSLQNVLVATPINTFVVRELKTIRMDQRPGKQLIAFHIEKVDGDQFEYLKTFIVYLDTFMKNDEETDQRI